MTLIYEPQEDSYLFSEVLEEFLPSLLDINPDLNFLEVGSGSGIQLKKVRDLGVKNILGLDINREAVEHCKTLGFEVFHSNLFEKVQGKYDLIIFNPPYLPEDLLEDKESKLATTGGSNGSKIINSFLMDSKSYLKKGGKIFLLTSSLTKGINWSSYKKELIKERSLFFEKLFIWRLTT